MEADWFETADGHLYLVPLPDVVAEVEGPDDDVCDAINAICREHGRLTDADCARLELNRIPDFLKRFDPSTGYYHA